MAVRNRKIQIGRQSRVALCTALLAFVLIQMALVAHMEFWRPQWRDLEFGRKLNFLEQRLTAQPERPLLLMLGSSRTLLGFQADALEGLPGGDGRPLVPFNFGLTGAGPLKQWVTLRTLLDRGIQPRRLLVEIMPPLLNQTGPQRMSEEQWLVISRLAATDILRLTKYHSRRKRLGWNWMATHLVPSYFQRYSILSEIDEAWLPQEPYLRTILKMNPSGWIPGACEVFNARDRQKYEEAERGQYIRAFVDYKIGVGAGQAVRDLLELCQREQIETVLVLMPEAQSFRAMYTPAAESELQGLVAELQQTFGVACIDARGWVRDGEFFDSHHLMTCGAATFTAKLRAELEARPEIWTQARRAPACQ
jgi:hypothetical protein